MKVYERLEDFSTLPNAVVTTGTFDGVHVGHKKIISRLQDIAAACKGETVILTFHPHPRLVLFPDDNDLRLLNTQSEKIDLLQKMGIQHLVIIPFNKEFSRISSLDFVRNILVKQIGAKKLAIGHDHHFGRNREGSFEHLKEFGPLYGFDVEEIPVQDIDHVAVSSSKIRQALNSGNIKVANEYLGYPYSLSGKVVKGNQRGRTIDYPTANIEVSEARKLIPAIGVYAVKVTVLGKNYSGMMNIGHRPTVGGGAITLEVNIFDFNADIYDQTLSVQFIERIRSEQKFEHLEALKAQLALDKTKALELTKKF
ncbi:MAG: bifunctional riboflavin kinase/FAD synthetase [Bacteroidetes bacterium]|nr:bifunctional riboflavin kinase/FAD synthetase [Bacteroidota bacterium]